MKQFLHGKTRVILLALTALAGLIVLAAGLGGMEFDQPRGMGLENLFNFSDLESVNDVPSSYWIRYFLLGMFVILFLLFLGPMRPQAGRDLIKLVMRFFLFAFVLILFMGRIAQANPALMEELDAAGQGGNPGEQAFSPPDVTAQWEYWITALVFVGIGVVVIVLFNRLMDRWFQPKTGLDEIADIARETLSDLSGHTASKNAIIRCYARMSEAANKWGGISRNAAMTPAEFAELLESAGLPGGEVRDLTRVFERVRYGAQNVSPQEIKEARQCLTGILKVCEAQQ